MGTCFCDCSGFSSNAVASQLPFMCPLGLVNIPRFSWLLVRRPFTSILPPPLPPPNRGGSPEHFKQSRGLLMRKRRVFTVSYTY